MNNVIKKKINSANLEWYNLNSKLRSQIRDKMNDTINKYLTERARMTNKQQYYIYDCNNGIVKYDHNSIAVVSDSIIINDWDTTGRYKLGNVIWNQGPVSVMLIEVDIKFQTNFIFYMKKKGLFNFFTRKKYISRVFSIQEVIYIDGDLIEFDEEFVLDEFCCGE